MIHSVKILDKGTTAVDYRAGDAAWQEPTDNELEVHFDQHYGLRLVHSAKDPWALIQFRVGGSWSEPVPASRFAEAQFKQSVSRKPAQSPKVSKRPMASGRKRR